MCALVLLDLDLTEIVYLHDIGFLLPFALLLQSFLCRYFKLVLLDFLQPGQVLPNILFVINRWSILPGFTLIH